MSELPERGVIRALFEEQQTGKMTVKLTGGTFSIAGAPVNEICWSIDENKKEASITVEAEKVVEIEESYLQKQLDWINNQFNIFVLMRTDNAN